MTWCDVLGEPFYSFIPALVHLLSDVVSLFHIPVPLFKPVYPLVLQFEDRLNTGPPSHSCLPKSIPIPLFPFRRHRESGPYQKYAAASPLRPPRL